MEVATRSLDAETLTMFAHYMAHSVEEPVNRRDIWLSKLT